MKMSGEERIPAPREQVWRALNDPAILKKSIAGCKQLEKHSDTEFSATVQAKVGPVKATFNGDVKLSKLKPPQSYVLSGQGKGGVAGFAKGKANVNLAEDGDETILTYDVDAQVGGKLAQIGSRLIGSTAKKMANDFFKKFAKLASDGATEPTASKPVKKKATSKKAPAKKKATAKKAAVKKAAVKKTAAAKAPSAKAKRQSPQPSKQAPETAKPAPTDAATAKPAITPQPPNNTAEPTHKQSSPLVAIVLAGLGALIILAFLLLFGGIS